MASWPGSWTHNRRIMLLIPGPGHVPCSWTKDTSFCSSSLRWEECVILWTASIPPRWEEWSLGVFSCEWPTYAKEGRFPQQAEEKKVQSHWRPGLNSCDDKGTLLKTPSDPQLGVVWGRGMNAKRHSWILGSFVQLSFTCCSLWTVVMLEHSP